MYTYDNTKAAFYYKCYDLLVEHAGAQLLCKG